MMEIMRKMKMSMSLLVDVAFKSSFLVGFLVCVLKF